MIDTLLGDVKSYKVLQIPFLRTKPEAEFLRQILVFWQRTKVTLLSAISRSKGQKPSWINNLAINTYNINKAVIASR